MPPVSALSAARTVTLAARTGLVLDLTSLTSAPIARFLGRVYTCEVLHEIQEIQATKEKRKKTSTGVKWSPA